MSLVYVYTPMCTLIHKEYYKGLFLHLTEVVKKKSENRLIIEHLLLLKRAFRNCSRINSWYWYSNIDLV